MCPQLRNYLHTITWSVNPFQDGLTRLRDVTFRVYKDAGTTKIHLIGHMEEVTMPLANLLLTGRATRYIHNGTLVYDKDGELLVGTT